MQISGYHAMSESASELAARFGLRRSGHQWRGTCPNCGYRDAFVVTERQRRALAWCASCGNRGVHCRLIEDAGSLPARASSDRAPHADAAAAAERTARALALWQGAQSALGTAADWYLTNRALPGVSASPSLRFRADTPHPEQGGRLPAMIALVLAPNGNPVAIHRTYLRRDGSGKAAVTPQKATLGPFRGGAIRLDPVAPELVIGEGIESSASAGRILDLPAWAAISAGNLARSLLLPAEVRSIVIACDNDSPNERGQRPGQVAARDAWHRWTAEGRKVRVAVPERADRDFNDVLVARRAQAVSHG